MTGSATDSTPRAPLGPLAFPGLGQLWEGRKARCSRQFRAFRPSHKRLIRAWPPALRAVFTHPAPNPGRRRPFSRREAHHTRNTNPNENNTCRTTLKLTSQVRSKLLIPLVNFPEFFVDSLVTPP